MIKIRFNIVSSEIIEDGKFIQANNNKYSFPTTTKSASLVLYEKPLNELSDENEQLKKENQEYKSLFQDMGLLMSDEEVVDIRNEISDKLLKPLLKGNGFDVDINTDDGFKIIPKGDCDD